MGKETGRWTGQAGGEPGVSGEGADPRRVEVEYRGFGCGANGDHFVEVHVAGDHSHTLPGVSFARRDGPGVWGAEEYGSAWLVLTDVADSRAASRWACDFVAEVIRVRREEPPGTLDYAPTWRVTRDEVSRWVLLRREAEGGAEARAGRGGPGAPGRGCRLSGEGN